MDFCGQIVDSVRRIDKPTKGWTAAELSELATLWDRWHLNGMKAGCTHQADNEVVCPDTGYRYGHAWLVEPLPADVAARIRELAAKLDGSTP